MPNDLSAVLPIVVVSLWACALLLIEAFLPERARPVVAAYGGMVEVDGLGRFLQVLFLVAGILAVPLAVDYIQRRGIGRGEYYTLLMFSVAGMMLMAVAADLVIVFLALELLSIPLYVLAAFAWPYSGMESRG